MLANDASKSIPFHFEVYNFKEMLFNWKMLIESFCMGIGFDWAKTRK